MRQLLIVAWFVALSTAAFADGEPGTSQLLTDSLELKPGWNFVAFAAPPKSPKIETVFAAALKDNALLSIWTFEASSGWSRAEFGNRTNPGTPPKSEQFKLPQYPNKPGKLDGLAPGRGYWVEIQSGIKTATITCSYEVAPVAFDIQLTKGWNLVGFDAEKPSSGGLPRSSVQAVFGDTLPEAILGYDRANEAFVEEKNWFNRSVAYWVLVKQDDTLSPSVETYLDADVDNPPLGDFPGMGDIDLNGNRKVDDRRRQDVISLGHSGQFAEFTIRAEGRGVLSFYVSPLGNWRGLRPLRQPYGKVADVDGKTPQGTDWTSFPNANWIRAVEPRRSVLPRTTLDVSGQDVRESSVRITIDRSGLLPGNYLSSFLLATSAGAKTIFLHFSVPPLTGNFEGVAKITGANGKVIDVGTIDLRLCLDQHEDGTIVGVIDRDGTSVVPADVPLVGHVLGTHPQRILLNAAYSLPGRRKNAVGGNNPFNSRLVRFISIDGIEVVPGQFNGSVHDSIVGALPYPVIVTGRKEDGGGVSLRRVAAKSFGEIVATVPIPDKEAPPTKDVSGVVIKPSGEPSGTGRVLFVGMGRATAASVNPNGNWTIKAAYPGIYRLFHDSGTTQLVAVQVDGSVSRLDTSSATEPGTQIVVGAKTSAKPSTPVSGRLASLDRSYRLSNSQTGNPTLKMSVTVHYGMTVSTAAQPDVTFSPTEAPVIANEPVETRHE